MPPSFFHFDLAHPILLRLGPQFSCVGHRCHRPTTPPCGQRSGLTSSLYIRQRSGWNASARPRPPSVRPPTPSPTNPPTLGILRSAFGCVLPNEWEPELSSTVELWMCFREKMKVRIAGCGQAEIGSCHGIKFCFFLQSVVPSSSL